jgi:hypothetical protein
VAFLLEHSLPETNCGTSTKAAKAVIGNSKKDRLSHPFQVLPYGPGRM